MKPAHALILCLALLVTGCARPTASPPPRIPEVPVALVDAAPEFEPHVRTAPVAEAEKPVPQPPAASEQKPPVLQPKLVEPPAQIPVLLYHDLAHGAKGGNGATVDVAEFEWQMDWLAQNGFTPVTTAELLAWLQGKGQLPPRPVAIQFDDGYRSNYTHALPIMKKHGMKGVLFLVSGFPGEEGMVTWAQVKEMAASGSLEIQGHAHAGHGKTGTAANLVAWDTEQIRADYRAMAESFAGAGLAAPVSFAYPFGAHDDETVAALRAEGVRAAFTVNHGYVRRGDDPFRLKRLIVWPGMSTCQFAGLVRGEQTCP
ncbi:MAG TPA: polysaccharide deacetylase family protein [Symbiobacteriaceae bacterium]|nr:polysaccharide deacetylase family protein [Symbiobacteriaceae bacterium]